MSLKEDLIGELKKGQFWKIKGKKVTKFTGLFKEKCIFTEKLRVYTQMIA